MNSHAPRPPVCDPTVAPALTTAGQAARPAAETDQPRQVRAVFVSDLHIGSKSADTAALIAFLRAHRFTHLYLVGDVIDGWKLEKRWHWTAESTALIRLLVQLRRARVRIVVVTGNHDEKLRDVLPLLFRPFILRRFGLRIEERCLHRGARGRRFVVMHGDQFDGALLRGTSKIADRIWAWLGEKGMVRPRREMTVERGLRRRWSLRKAITSNAHWLVHKYHRRALRRAREDRADGIICGHSHVPALKVAAGTTLADCGDWTLSSRRKQTHAAVIETLEGEIELAQWPVTPAHAPQAAGDALAGLPDEPDAARLVRLIRALWHPPQRGARAAGRGAAQAPRVGPDTPAARPPALEDRRRA